jgi:hypothetical protein
MPKPAGKVAIVTGLSKNVRSRECRPPLLMAALGRVLSGRSGREAAAEIVRH